MILLSLGCSRKNPHPPDGWDSGNSRGRGVKDPGNLGGRGGWTRRSLLQGSFQPIVHAIGTFSLVTLLALPDPENSNENWKYKLCTKILNMKKKENINVLHCWTSHLWHLLDSCWLLNVLYSCIVNVNLSISLWSNEESFSFHLCHRRQAQIYW